MKKSIVYLLLLLATRVVAGDVKFVKAMEGNIAMIDSATTNETYQQAASAIEKLANTHPGEWLTYYYQSYCMVMVGIKQPTSAKKDEYYDKADRLIEKADSISPRNSEIYVMKGFISGLKISLDSISRGPQLGTKTSLYHTQAIEYDKENPRAYLMKGTGLMNTPSQYGGGKKAALPLLEMAVEKFKTFKPSSTIMPHWGQSYANRALEQCRKME
jgi:tetratricopeptide (TPR) repeat protein